MKEKQIISTNILKAISILFVILMHSLTYNPMADYNLIYKEYGFDFWVGQAVSIFVIITGFHYSISSEKLCTELEWYRKDVFLKKIVRIVPAYTLIVISWFIYISITKTGKVGINSIFIYLKGGAGPGGYYNLIVIQLLIIFPIVYNLIKKYPVYGSMALLLFNIVYEYLVRKDIITSSFNRLCCIRLLFGLVLGIIIYKYREQLKKTVIPVIIFLFGLCFLLYHNYGDYKTLFVKSWIVNSFLPMCYSAGIVYFVVTRESFFEKLKKDIIWKKILGCIEYVGKASYHIFLTQQLWFCINVSFRSNFRIRYVCIIDGIICVVIGCIFYTVQKIVLKRIEITSKNYLLDELEK